MPVVAFGSIIKHYYGSVHRVRGMELFRSRWSRGNTGLVG